MSPSQDELLNLLHAHEDNFVERKLEGLKPSDIRKTAVAFANSVPEGRFGVLFVGVRDDGKVAGCKNPDAKQREILSILQECYPPIVMISEVLRTGDGDVVAVIIGPSNNRPHFAGHAYVRQGSASVTASPEIFRELVNSQNSVVAAILRLKGNVVSFVSLQHRIGEVRKIEGSGYRQVGECFVLECGAQFARFQLVGGESQYFSEPIDHIKVMRDENRHKPMLVFTGY